MSRRDARVEARERAERLRHALIGFWPAGQIADGVPHLPRLLEKAPLPDPRTAKLEPRTVSVDSKTAVVRAAQARPEAVGVELPLILGAPRLDDDNARREAPVLDRVRIWQHAHRLDRIVRQRHPR